MKHYTYLLVIFTLFHFVSSVAQDLPLGYIPQYHQDFSKKSSLNNFNISSPGSWVINGEKQNYCLEFTGNSTYSPTVISPGNIGVLSKYMFGDFILEADFKPAGKENDYLDICIFFGLRDTLKYYYVHITSLSGKDSLNIFLVNEAEQTGIGAKIYGEVQLSENKWNKLRVERDIVLKTITVYVNDMSAPVMKAKDKTLIMGYIGFGTFEGSGKLDNINIYAPTAIPQEADIFKH